ncbi:MAG: peptidoglycan DD-metalloendopeptidase family protein [Candidatus Acidiferrales bacterium]
MNNKWKAVLCVVLLAAAAACAALAYNARLAAENDVAMQASFAREEARHIQEEVVLFSDSVVPARLPFQVFLQGLGIAPDAAAHLISSAQSVFDFRHVRAGNRITVGRSILGELREVRYRIDADRVLNIAPQGHDFHSEIQTIPSETKTVGVTGEIRGSLFNAVTDAGEKPELAMRLADIFGWDLDFYTDPRPGDTFRVVVEKKMLANGELSSYGRILAAEYNNGNHPYRAVLFHGPSGLPAYYTPDGKSMKKAFLHSPLKFAAVITSHFSEHRFHPILKEYRPHLGIDYAAPTGTPVQTIGDGRVIFAGRKGGAGNLIEIQHSNGYTTYYMHLSRVLVRQGQRVEQGQRIGLVGMTGLATGPHLDFRIQRGKDFLNFERLPLPPSDPVAKRDWSDFAAQRDQAMPLMPPLPSQQGTTALAKNAAPASLPPAPSSIPAVH